MFPLTFGVAEESGQGICDHAFDLKEHRARHRRTHHERGSPVFGRQRLAADAAAIAKNSQTALLELELSREDSP